MTRPLASAFSLLIILTTVAAPAETWTLKTLAGSTSGGGYVDASGVNARFSYPHGVAVDLDGNIFVTDRGNHVVRRVAPDGTVSTFAGLAGVSGSNDGRGAAARFYYPSGIAFDPTSRNLYVADSWNDTIRKITPDATVTTLAGSPGKWGLVNGNGSAARFSYPQGVAVDQAGFVWVADTSNHAIRRITGSNATVTTFVGSGSWGGDDGLGSSARFHYPFGIAVDANGNLWVADSSNNEIREVTREGVVSTVAGDWLADSGSSDGTGKAARFDNPWGIAVAPNGDVWVTDSNNDTIRRVTVGGVVTTVAGNGYYGCRDGAATSARFAFPTGIAFDSIGNAYIADRESQAIRRIAATTLTVSTLAGSTPQGGTTDGVGTEARLFFPMQAVSDATGNIYYADDAHTIRKISPSGVVTTIAGMPGTSGSADGIGSAARFRSPSGIALDQNGNLWVADTGNHTIRKITADGSVKTVAGSPGVVGKADGIGSQARFNEPWGLAFDSAGNLYIADAYNHMIRVMDPNGVVTVYAGNGTEGSWDSSALNAEFDYPIGLAADAAGNLYVADWGNDTIRKITAAGAVSTLAGHSGTSGSTDGTGNAAQFNGPFSVALDRSGSNLYVADENNHTIRKVSLSGVVTTILGQAVSPGNVDGAGSAARLFYPKATVIDGQGRLIVSDTYNHAIRVATVAPPTISFFRADPSTLLSPRATLLSWATTDATSVSIMPGFPSMSVSGSLSVFLDKTTTYTLSANGPGGTTTAQVTVAVGGTSKRRSVKH